jgi:hypothetical protein
LAFLGVQPSFLAAAGTTQETATPLSLFCNVTVTSGTGGVLLLPAAFFVNVEMPILNRSGATIVIYPYFGDAIEGNATDVGIPILDNATARFSVDQAGMLRLA